MLPNPSNGADCERTDNLMKLCGLQKTTLLDFPGLVAATVFLDSCNFRCPFCHNADLVLQTAGELLSQEELLAFLRKRKGILDGVCITGGEPTLWPEELKRLMAAIKDLGYQVKLDTNGYRPDVLKQICELGLADYVAMDIKAGRFHYAEVCGLDGVRIERIEESAAWLMQGQVPYEFRTTTVRGLHTAEDFTDIAAWLQGCKQYFLQGFVDSGHVLQDGFSAFSRAELETFRRLLLPSIPCAEIRGVDY